jgi:DNA-binding SARP family transcriptional activator
MEFRILGSLEVWEGERQLELAGPKRRAVLAYLLLHANEVVAVDRLVDQLWGEKAPRNAVAALHTHVSRLRKELGADVIARRAWGYVLRIEPEALDLERFERFSAAAENLPARERAARLREALALWRGPPLEDLAFEPGLAADIARLEELRLTVLENRIDADLEAGDQAGLAGELEALIAQHPLRERLRGQLILALYRSGRQAEALEVYRETRRLLADELGLEPSPELRELERAILQQDPALRVRPETATMVVEQGVRPGRRRRVYIGALLALFLAGLGIAAAVGFTTRTTRGTDQPATSDSQNAHGMGWNSLEPVSKSDMHSFAQLVSVDAPADPHPGLRAGQVRKVPLRDGGIVWVALVADGGICEDYNTIRQLGSGSTRRTELQSGAAACDRSRSLTINPTLSRDLCGGVLIEGHVNAKPGSRLQLGLSGPSALDLPLTWVGPPIDAGFFTRPIPAGKHMTSLELTRPNGAIVAAISVSKTKLSQGLNLRAPCAQRAGAGSHAQLP